MSKFTVSRRSFVAGASAFAAVAPTVLRAQGAPRVFKFAVVGCGGRGGGAANDITKAAERLGFKAQLVAASDFFPERAVNVCKKYGVDEKFAFGGAAGYQKVMETDAEIVLLCTPPFFRPLHFDACVKAGKHIFAEKPIATDPAGLRRFLAGVEAAKAAKLSVLSGTCYRHSSRALRQIGPIQGGAIGRVCGGVVYRCHGGTNTWGNTLPRKDGESNAGYMSRSWYGWRHMSGDNLTEQGIHEVDLANWFIGRTPRAAMAIGARHRRATGNGYDCVSVDYDYDDGLHVHAIARQVDGCADRCHAFLSGAEGEITILGKIKRYDGKEIGPDEKAVEGRHEDMMMMEHVDHLAALAKGELLAEGEQVAMASATTIMGTLAAYSGQAVRMSDLLTNKDSALYDGWNNPFLPDDFDKGDVPLPEEFKAPVPGN
ncbi:MAG: Gfo/Idh/MocA family oxidoreductase [Kiritimatiellaeota bacterium]|nr:Gfo/Idh/MocA family oxidoreductase [Kiritimatiellota bacterium]